MSENTNEVVAPASPKTPPAAAVTAAASATPPPPSPQSVTEAEEISMPAVVLTPAATSTPVAPISATATRPKSEGVVESEQLAIKIDDDTIFHKSVAKEEREYYIQMYPTYSVVRERKPHCTVCKQHIGTAPRMEGNIKMHPILRVTHCNKCHDFYNSGEFSKGEDGSELYCRWCGQGGEVYCCSSCPFVFCKSCIVKNLSRSVILDIESNENWSCFSCQPKILWPLRSMHWALMHFIQQQKCEIAAKNLNESETRVLMYKDTSTCCRLAKSKCGNMSDSLESIDSIASKRSIGSNSGVAKKIHKPPSISPSLSTSAKRQKIANNEVVCTPDLLSMLEPDCQIVVPKKIITGVVTPTAPTSRYTQLKVSSVQSNYASNNNSGKTNAPPPLVLRNTSIEMRHGSSSNMPQRRSVGPRNMIQSASNSPVYHVINGFRIDLNTAAQQDTFRLPNGKMIQVKRQSQVTHQQNTPTANSNNNWQQRNTSNSGISSMPMHPPPRQIHLTPSNPSVSIQHVSSTPYSVNSSASTQQQHLPQNHPQMIRYQNTMSGNNSTVLTPVTQNGVQVQVAAVNSAGTATQASRPIVMLRHDFPDSAIGCARKQLQEQVFGTVDICNHLTGKVQTLTNSNAYKQAKNYLEVKELYIHLSYLLTYAIGRYKNLQDKCLNDMRQLGFTTDADSLENGQLAADKQASDDEDIEIIEPQQETINLDSDNDEDDIPTIVIPKPTVTLSAKRVGISPQKTPRISSNNANNSADADFHPMNCLANMLDVDITEGDTPIQLQQKKQPRKKTTHRPNPSLLKQMQQSELKKAQDMISNDVKLKSKCVVELQKVEIEFPEVKKFLSIKEDDKMSTAEKVIENENAEKTDSWNNSENNETSNKDQLDKELTSNKSVENESCKVAAEKQPAVLETVKAMNVAKATEVSNDKIHCNNLNTIESAATATDLDQTVDAVLSDVTEFIENEKINNHKDDAAENALADGDKDAMLKDETNDKMETDDTTNTNVSKLDVVDAEKIAIKVAIADALSLQNTCTTPAIAETIDNSLSVAGKCVDVIEDDALNDNNKVASTVANAASNVSSVAIPMNVDLLSSTAE